MTKTQLLSELVKIASALDEMGDHTSADAVDNVSKGVAEKIWSSDKDHAFKSHEERLRDIRKQMYNDPTFKWDSVSTEDLERIENAGADGYYMTLNERRNPASFEPGSEHWRNMEPVTNEDGSFSLRDWHRARGIEDPSINYDYIDQPDR